jgi:acetoin utilization deacetylase AcuC-like enzyme
MHAYYCDTFVLPLPEGHSFPMQKYAQLREAVYRELGAFVRLRLPPRAADADLSRVHCPDYIARVMQGTLSVAEQRKIGFPWSMEMAERSRRVSGATSAVLADALQGEGIAVNLAGGTHHAFYDSGGGYCIFNDSVVAARAALAAGIAERVLVIDLDVHQGNGTAALCANDVRITTFSMHGEKNYPAVKQLSDIDVALPSGTADTAYLQALREHLPLAFAKAQPDAVIYLAGADPFEGDRLGLLKLSKAALRARDEMVLDYCFERHVPVAVTMAGGYAPDVADIVDIHLGTVRLALRFYQRWQQRIDARGTFACAQPSE